MTLRAVAAVGAVAWGMGPAGADPLGLVDYDALLGARAEHAFCTAGQLCTVLLPDGGVVQQDANGQWLAGGDAQTAGSFALAFALILAIYDHCGRHLEGVEPEVLSRAVGAMQEAYRQGLMIDGLGQTAPTEAAVAGAFETLHLALADYVAADRDLSQCIVPGPLAIALVDMAQEATWGPQLTALAQTPVLPTANFAIE